MTTMRTITPCHLVSGERLTLSLPMTDEQYQALLDRKPGWSFVGKDSLSGDAFLVKSAPCGIPNCFCDAVAFKMTKVLKA